MKECKSVWSDKTADTIIRDIINMQNSLRRQCPASGSAGITVISDETTCNELRQLFPEHIAMVKFIPCSYVEKGKCLVMRDQGFLLRR